MSVVTNCIGLGHCVNVPYDISKFQTVKFSKISMWKFHETVRSGCVIACRRRLHFRNNLQPGYSCRPAAWRPAGRSLVPPRTVVLKDAWARIEAHGCELRHMGAHGTAWTRTDCTHGLSDWLIDWMTEWVIVCCSIVICFCTYVYEWWNSSLQIKTDNYETDNNEAFCSTYQLNWSFTPTGSMWDSTMLISPWWKSARYGITRIKEA